MPGHKHARPSLGEVTSKLRRQSRRITGPRAAMVDVLKRQPHPVTIKQLFKLLPDGLCDLATVYRSIHMLEEMGFVQRFDFGDGVARYEMKADDEHGHHHHHLVCTECTRVVEIEECFAEEIQKTVASQNGFRSVTHKLEFFGVCPDCQ